MKFFCCVTFVFTAGSASLLKFISGRKEELQGGDAALKKSGASFLCC